MINRVRYDSLHPNSRHSLERRTAKFESAGRDIADGMVCLGVGQ